MRVPSTDKDEFDKKGHGSKEKVKEKIEGIEEEIKGDSPKEEFEDEKEEDSNGWG